LGQTGSNQARRWPSLFFYDLAKDETGVCPRSLQEIVMFLFKWRNGVRWEHSLEIYWCVNYFWRRTTISCRPSFHLSSMMSGFLFCRGPNRFSCRHQIPYSPWPRHGFWPLFSKRPDPRSLPSMCSAFRFCLSVYLPLSPFGIGITPFLFCLRMFRLTSNE